MRRKKQIQLVVAFALSLTILGLLTVYVAFPLMKMRADEIKRFRDVPFIRIGVNDSPSGRLQDDSQITITNRDDILTLWRSRASCAYDHAKWMRESQLPPYTEIGWVSYPGVCSKCGGTSCASCKHGYSQDYGEIDPICSDGTVVVGLKLRQDSGVALIKMPGYRDTFLSLCNKYGLSSDKKTKGL